MASKNVAVRSPPALNPEQLAITQPWKDFLSRGLITSLEVVFTPGGANVSLKLAGSVPIPNGVERDSVPPGIAKQAILDSGLVPKQGKAGTSKKEEPLPVRSLCAKDTEMVDKIAERIKQVANKLGPSTALGRIGSQKLEVEGAHTFEEWWSGASVDKKVKLVMDKKHLDSLSSEQLLIIEEALKKVGSPFRGPLPDNSQNNEKKEEDNKKEEKPPRANKPRAPTPPKK